MFGLRPSLNVRRCHEQQSGGSVGCHQLPEASLKPRWPSRSLENISLETLNISCECASLGESPHSSHELDIKGGGGQQLKQAHLHTESVAAALGPEAHYVGHFTPRLTSRRRTNQYPALPICLEVDRYDNGPLLASWVSLPSSWPTPLR